MLKFTGIVGLVAALGLIGILKAEELKSRVKDLEDFLRMCLFLKSKINYLREPLTYAYSTGNSGSGNRADLLLHEVFVEIDEKQGEIEEIWAQKANEIYKTSRLTKADMNYIRYPGKFIGQTDYENQLYQFEYIQSSLENQIKEADEELKRKGPLYRKLGFFAGALIGIILI